MNCPNCQALCAQEDRFCHLCGAPLQYQPKPKKGTHWIPIAIMSVLCALGIALFFIIPSEKASTTTPSSTTAESQTPWFQVENGTLYFYEEYYTGSEELEVPSLVDGQIITAIGDGCFAGCDTLTTVKLPAGIKTIGASAFSGCTSLRGIFLPEGITTIGENAFLGCTSLEAICVPSTVTSIGSNCFDDCNLLLYVFYSGTADHWTALYDEFIALYTGIYCTDESFYQGGNPN